MIPKAIESKRLTLEGEEILVNEYDESESKHIATLFLPSLRALIASDLIYNDTHCYLQERHLEEMPAKYPHNHAKQFLTAFSVPAYFPAKGPADG